MFVDCRSCPVRDVRCGECLVPVLLAMSPPGAVESEERTLPLDVRERAAVDLLHGAGLITLAEAASAVAVPERRAVPRYGVAAG